jgi:hypothetical protein
LENEKVSWNQKFNSMSATIDKILTFILYFSIKALKLFYFWYD